MSEFLEYINTHPEIDPIHLLATILYGLLGIALAITGYKVFERVVPFDVNKELEEDHNTSVAIVIGSIILGVSAIVAVSIAV